MEEISKVIKSRVHHGFNISIARNRKGLKQAAMLGISQQRLSQLENQRVVKDEILEKVSEATGVSIEDLKTIEEPMSVYIENNNNTISDPANDKIYIGNNIEQDNSSFTNNTNRQDRRVIRTSPKRRERTSKDIRKAHQRARRKSVDLF